MNLLDKEATKLIVNIQLNTWGGTPARLTEEWISERISIFMTYTLNSLKNQTSQNFDAFIIYDKITSTIIKQLLAKYAPLPENIKFVTPEEYKTHLGQLIRGYHYFYIVYLDSDDMYHKSFIDLLHKYTPKEGTRALVPQYGYVFDSVQNRLGRFFFWLPAYGATVYNVKEYLMGNQPILSWRDALKVPNEFINIKVPIWINHVHSRNTGIWFDKILSWKIRNINDACELEPWTDSVKPRAYFGPQITDQNEKIKILEDFY